MADASARLDQFLAADHDGRIKCKACDSVPPDVMEAVEAAHARGTTVSALRRFLLTDGYPMSDSTIRRHLSGQCK